MDPWDVIVVGAGAAGLMAAIRAAERGRRTLLLERNAKAGVKILMSGGTRCNLTHDTDARGIVAAYGRGQGPFLHSALAALGPRELREFFHAEGVPTKVEPNKLEPGGKVFPASDSARDVLVALLRRLERSGARLELSRSVTGIAPAGGAVDGAGFVIRTDAGDLAARKLVLTPGGASYPKSGTRGDGYAWATGLGLRVEPPRPALVPLTLDAPRFTALAGVTVPDVEVQVLEKGSGVFCRNGPKGAAHKRLLTPFPQTKGRPTCLARRRGSLLFTHLGLSGPAVLDVSRAVSGHPTKGGHSAFSAEKAECPLLCCDFLPEVAAEELDRHLQQAAAVQGRRHPAALLPESIPRRLAAALAEEAGARPDDRAAQWPAERRRALVRCVKELALRPTGTLGWAKAEVTAGGVALDQVDSRDMQCKRVDGRRLGGLYLAGEILDLDGPIGGYNFQAAFSTGWLVGERV